jgi:CheY-like chemotaxis protein
MRFFFWPKPKTINDLRDVQTVAAGKPELAARRSVRIAVIDDEPFHPEQTLRELGYDVTFLGNVAPLHVIGGFQILLCDLKGVFVESHLQGAALIKQIRNSYPHIYVIAYTGALPTSILHRAASAAADEIVEKASDVDRWMSVLDRYVHNASEPSEFWQRFRLRLAEKGISAVQLMILEDAFVRAVIKREPRIFSEVAGNVDLPEGVKPIIEGVTSHFIAHAVISAVP